ncbi:MAG: hypothetical protein GF400_06895, partial [Candidatus Eisenbacteria bacterium]|nr:hypothetical protein [Candidatus Eisenbacteria bacterium]
SHTYAPPFKDVPPDSGTVAVYVPPETKGGRSTPRTTGETAVADSMASAVSDSTTSAVADSTASAVADSMASAVGDSTGSAVVDSKAPAAADSTASAVADSMASAVADSTGSAVADSTTSAIADSAASRPTVDTCSEMICFRQPSRFEGSFTRPWTPFSKTPRGGLGPRRIEPPAEVDRSLPFERHTEVDLDARLVVVEIRAGDHLSYASYVSDMGAYLATRSRLAAGSKWRHVALENLRRQEAVGGLLDIDIPMPLPGPFVRAIGPGANLKVRGSERITFGGQTSYVVDALESESGEASRFPQLDMEQQLNVNLEGTIGRKIHVYVDHRSGGDTFGSDKANQIRVRYEGDEDEIIQRIELGEVNLSLPGTEFVSYSGHHEGLFGAKMTSKIGKLDVVTIASKEEGKSAGASFVGGSESESLELDDIDYERYTFYAPDSDVLKTNEEFSSLKVYIDDRDGSNDIETGAVPGRAFLYAPSDTSAPEPPYDEPYQIGRFDELIELEDYVIARSQNNVQVGIIEFLRPVAASSVIAVSYTTTEGRVVGGMGQDGALRLKMIKKDGGIPQDWAPIRNHELKNVYDLGSEDIPEEGFELTIRKRSSTGEDPDVNEDGVPYLQIFGLDTEDLSGNPTPDNIVDYERIDFERGYLLFPHYTPFCPAYDETTNFYYPAGSSAYTEYASELDPKNCLVYSKDSFDPNDDIYYIQVNYDRPKTTFSLGHINIIENSEVVRVNGVRLTRGTDYTIYYPAGQLTLLAEEAKDPDARVTVDYDYKPFGIGGEKTLLGTRGVYNWSENIQLGTTWMYQSKGTAEDRPRLGEEPSRTIVGDVNLTADFAPEFMTTMADAIPFVDTDAPSHLEISGEAAVSIPEPNTKGFVSIDDMEGTENVSMLGVTRRLWVPSSVPVDEFGEPAVPGSLRRYVSWYNPDRLVRRGHLFPYLEESEYDDIQSVLALSDYYYDEPWGGGEWGGLMRLLSKFGNDYSDYEFFEFWVKVGEAPEDVEGVIHIDLGTISEDFYPLRAPNGEWDTEDYDKNGFDADEDTGLDNCCSTGECESQVEGCVDDTSPTDDYVYSYENAPDDYRRINGTENNDRLDTEDLNGNYIADHDNRYWSLEVDLENEDYLVFDNMEYEEPDKRSNWRLYRMPLADAVPVGGIADWEVIKSARIWFEGLDLDSEVGDDPKVMFGSLDIVGSQWEPMKIRDEYGDPIPDDELHGESFNVTAKNTKEDEDYEPPFDPGVDEETNVKKREQSLALLFENLRGGHEAAARKLLYAEENYTRYGAMEFYVHGGPETEEGTEFFIRMGADSLNYYEYSLRLRTDVETVVDGWYQDRLSDRNRLKIPFTSLTNLKLGEFEDADTAAVWGDTARIDGERFKRVGWPSLSRVRQLTVGVRYAEESGLADAISGEVWVDDIRLTDVRKDIGWARRTTIDARFADLATVRFDMRQVDGQFHTLKQTQGSGQDNLTYNINGTVNADQFVRALGVAAPVTFTWRKSVTKPQFSTGSDVVLSDEQSAREKTESLDTSVAASLKRKRQSPNFWTHLLIDDLSLRGSVANHEQLSPTKADTSRTIRGSMAYGYNPSRDGIRIFRDMRIFLKPTSLRFSLNGYVTHRLNYDISSDGVKTKRNDNFDRKLSGEGHINFQLLENLKTSHSVKFDRDLSLINRELLGRNIGTETDRRYTNDLTFNARFGRWFAPQYSFNSTFSDDRQPSRRFSGRSNHELRTSFDLKKLIGLEPTGGAGSPSGRRPPRERGRGGGRTGSDPGDEAADDEPPDEQGEAVEVDGEEEEEQPDETPGFRVLLDPVVNFLRRMDAIDVQYRLLRSWQHNQVTKEDRLEGWTYRAGLAVDYGGDQWTEEHRLSLGTGVRLTNDIRLKGDYDRNVTNKLSRYRDPETLEFTGDAAQTESMNESTKGSVSWSGVEKIGPLSSLFRSINARSGVEYKRSYSGPNGDPNSRRKGLALSPVISLDSEFRNRVTTKVTWDRKSTRTFNLTGTGSVTEDKNSSLSVTLNYRFSAPQGLKLPFFGQKLKFESNLDTSLTMRMASNETRTAATEDGLTVAEPTSSTRDLSFTADANYSFSRNVSGGLQFNFSQSKDEKQDRTRRTIGLHLTAEFKF